MITKGQQELFNRSIIAQHDDQDYEESGYVAVVVGNWAALSMYNHCSCYGTWESLTGECHNDPHWDWTGTVDEMIALAKAKRDPFMPDREANKDDYEYDHLIEVYKQIVEWDKNGRKPHEIH